jgi:DNA modification methylase
VILTGDCIEILPTLESESVQCCVTSPPYYGLRDYGCAGQIGLEDSPGEYVEKLVAVFRELWRVLRNDGTVWLNLGDSYNGSGKAGKNPEYQAKHTEFGKPSKEKSRFGMPTNIKTLKPKDLIGIPWRVAFALQAYGWWLRQDIIWQKPNPMPESVTDRCTKAHEYIFLLTKSARYFYDNEATKEAAVYGIPNSPESIASPYGQGFTRRAACCSFSRNVNEEGKPGEPNQHRADRKDKQYVGTRNRRSVWTVATRPFREAHFATFPPEIPEICIKAGSKEGDTVLDPFSGAGTTGNVAERLNRQYIGIELNPIYAEMGDRRIDAAKLPLFSEATQ